MLMGRRLTGNLILLSASYVEATGIAFATLSKKAHKDSVFFERLIDGKVSFSARKYDQIVVWFWRNWPPGNGWRWPADVPRPTRQEADEIDPPQTRSKTHGTKAKKRRRKAPRAAKKGRGRDAGEAAGARS